MFRWLIGSSLKYRFLVAGVAAALFVFGSVQLREMPVDVYPEFAPPTVEVQTEAIGLSAEEVESLVTLNLEELLSGVPWLVSIRSQSVTGLSSIVLTFERGTDVMRARQMIQERLTLAYTLPNVAQPPVILQPTSATSRFMMVGVSSDQVEETELSLLARWNIKPRLLGVPGVANVAIWGQRLRQMQVQIDPERLHDARVGQMDIITAAGDALWVSPLTFLRGSMPGTGGWIDNPNQRIGVHHAMPIYQPEDMAKIAVSPLHLLMTGKSMALGDVAEVTWGHPLLIGDAVVDGGHGLMLVIEKFPSANTLEVTAGVEKALAELSRGLPGVKIDTPVFRLASYVEDSIDNLTWAMIIGAALVLCVIGAFLFHWRSALISAVAIPLSLLAALGVLSLTSATINVMILAGLAVALAVVIDDIVVDMHALMHRLRERPDGTPAAGVIFDTLLHTRSATVYASLIVILAVTPIFFMGGVAGAFFEPLALAYVLAVVASMLVGMTVTPALTLLLFARKPQQSIPDSPIAAALGRSYDSGLRRVVAAPRPVLLATAGLVAAGALVLPFLGQSLLPGFKEPQLLVNWTTAPGTSYKETYRITARLAEELRGLPGVRNIGAHVGRAITGDQVVGINASQIWVGIDADADHEETMAAVRRTVAGYPGVDGNVQTYLRDQVGHALTGENKPVVVRLYGPQREVLRHKAEEVRRVLADVGGLADLRIEGVDEQPEVRVAVDLERAGRASVKPGDVRRAAATVFSGLTVGYLYSSQQILDVVVWSPPEARASLTNLGELWVDKANGHYTRLGEVADIDIVPVPTVIRHERIAPYIDVTANVVGRDPGSVNREIEARLQKVDFPLEHHPEILGEYAERAAAQQRMLGVAVAAVIGIFLLLHACFRSWRYALVAFVALPASIAGGVIAALAGGGVISLGSIVGFLAVLGIAARNGVLLIKRYQDLEDEGMPIGPELVLRGARDRFPAILASSAAIIAALLPVVLFGHVAGLELAQPMAIVVIGGLIAATLVTLLVVPTMTLAFGRADREGADLGLEPA